MKLKGKVALITGAGSGIGRAAAILFAQEGACVALVGRTTAKLQHVASEIGLDDSRVFWVAADLSRREEAGRAVNSSAEYFGGLDIVLNNAGISRQGRLLEIDEPVFAELFAHNVKNPSGWHSLPFLGLSGAGVGPSSTSPPAWPSSPHLGLALTP